MNPKDFNGLLESVRHAGEIKRGLRPAARETVYEAAPRIPPAPFWAICLVTDDEALTPRKLYHVTPAAAPDRVWVTDEEGWPTCCPAAWFWPLSLPAEAEQLLQQAA